MAEKAVDNHKVVVFPKGSTLFKQEDISRDLYIIKSGKVTVYKTEEGVDIELDTAGPGSVVGEISAIDGGNRSASVMALEDTEALVVSWDEFRKIIDRLPDWFQKISRILVQRLRAADDRIGLSKGGNKNARVAVLVSLLTYTDQCTAQDGRWVFSQAVLENEIADMLVFPLSDATQSLESLQKLGLLALEKGKVVVSSRDKLDEYGSKLFKESEESPAI